MGIDRIKWNIAGFRALNNERGVMADLIRRAERVAAAAGPGVVVTPRSGKRRARVTVSTGTPEAVRRNAREQTLIRALDAGRD